MPLKPPYRMWDVNQVDQDVSVGSRQNAIAMVDLHTF
jgi:hypothetical protein